MTALKIKRAPIARVTLTHAVAAAAMIITLSLTGAADAQQAPRRWVTVANHMTDQRWAPASCTLAGGASALIAGGYSYAKDSCVSSIDIYDEAANRFHPSLSRLIYPRDFAQANLLPGGDVLISGGFNDVWASLDVAEVYDPATDTCRLARGKMNQHRELFQAVNLRDGTVLLVGGLDLWARTTVDSAEIFDPSTEQFKPTHGSLAQDRFGHAACLLTDGRVLVVGGTSWHLRTKQTHVLNSAEIYDPATGDFHLTRGPMSESRDRPTATLLPDGHVLVYGGQGSNGKAVTTEELFDPATEQFTIWPAPQSPRMAHSAISLLSGAGVLITGGWDADAAATTPSAVLFDPATREVSPLPDLPFATHDSAGAAFKDGAVLIAGGKSATKTTAGSTDEGVLMK